MDTPSLDRDTLLQFLHGKLSDTESEQITQMVENDPDLQKRLEELDHEDDTFIEMLRQYHEDTPSEGHVGCGDALEGAKNLFQNHNQSTPRQILGEYELLQRIGQGGMGVVFKARHLKLGRTVAIKVIADARAGDEKAIARFEREIKTIGQLEHPSIVHAHDAREIDGRSILVMEYVDGMDLGRLIRRHGPISIVDACELIRQTAVGLQAAHELGLVHRDIKPSNLMLDRQGNLKILDLGLAREVTDLKELQREVSMSFDLTQTGQAMGTADYMAPEQADRPDLVDIRADIYSTGCTLFKLLTGRAPYHEEMTFDKLSAHAEQPLPPTPDLPDSLRAILDRMTAKNPDDRFATPSEIADALAPFCTDHDLPALLTKAESQTTPARTLPRTASGGRFRRIITILLALAFSGGLGLFGGILLTINRDNKQTKLEIPTGAQAKINKEGNIAVNLPSATTNSTNQKFLDLTKKERQQLIGEWKSLSVPNRDNTPITPDCMKLIISKSHIEYVTAEKFHPLLMYKLDPTTNPKRIIFGASFDNKEIQLHGIYKIENNRLTLCKSPDGFPADFIKDLTTTFERVKPSAKANPSTVESKNQWKINYYLSPIKLRASTFRASYDDYDTGVTLDITSQPDQAKRWAGKTLRVTWSEGFMIGNPTSGGHANLEARTIQWPIPKEELKSRSYQLKFIPSPPREDAEFRVYAELLDAKAKPVWTNKIQRSVQKLSDKNCTATKNDKDRQNLFGLWKCVSAKIDGQAIAAKDLTHLKIIINEDHIVYPTSWKEKTIGKVTSTGLLVINATTNPKRMDFPYDLVAYSIYQLEDDRLTICYSKDYRSPTPSHPTRFISEPNSANNVLIVFERVKGPLPDSTPIADRSTYKLLFPNLFPDERTPPMPSMYTQPPTSGGPIYIPIAPTTLEPSLLSENEKERQQIDRLLSRRGTLEFRILANRHDNKELIERAEKEKGDQLLDEQGNRLAWWVPVNDKTVNDFIYSDSIAIRKVGTEGNSKVQVLVVNDEYNVTDQFLDHASVGHDPMGKPVVEFTFNEAGSRRFGGLTGTNLPDEKDGSKRQLGIILDGKLFSAPFIMSRITQRGIITGSFTEQEVEEIVDTLNSGSLPTPLKRVKTSSAGASPATYKDALKTPDDPKVDQEWKVLTGTWEVIRINSINRANREPLFSLRIEKDSIQFLDGRPEKKHPLSIDITTSPKQITWPYTINKSIYRLAGNTLTICSSTIPGEVPSEFREGVDGYFYTYLRRVDSSSQNETEQQKLIGTWKVVSVEDSGKKSPAGEIFDMKLIVGPKVLEWIGSGNEMKGKKPYTIDITTNPKRISWPHGMEQQYSIYKTEGNRLWICFSENKAKGHPTKFVSEKDSANDVLIMLERVKDKKTTAVTSSPK